MDNFEILIVDDLKDNLIALEKLLYREKRIFHKATTGAEALKLVLKYPDIGLILLDVQMPGMDGFEVAKLLNINPQTRNIPFIFVTSNYIGDKDILEGFETGAVDYLIKPLNPTITKSKVCVFEKLHYKQVELKKIIAERDIVNAQLERYTKVMAHDLKTPLAGIASLISLIRMNEKVQDIDDLIEELSMLETLSFNLANMITSVLEDSRRMHDEESEKEVSVEHLISKCITILQAPTSIRFKIDDNLPVFKTREITFQQVFQNLIGNAIKYNDKQRGVINIGCSDSGKFYKFHVRDNGPGIDPDDLTIIFEKFVTGKTKSNLDSSTGLGLHFLKLIIEEQGGRIWVESTPREGSTFYFLWRK